MALRIEDYALLGDMQSAALVGRDGSVDWLCMPRFDSAAMFAGLLGDDENGHWRLCPAAGGLATRRAYRPGTLVLDTEWDTPEGTLRVTDFMPPRDEAPDVVRIVECLSGRVAVHSVLRLRFDYGHVVPWVRRGAGGHVAIAGPDAVWLREDVHTRGEGSSTVADFALAAGERASFVLTWSPSHLPEPTPVRPVEALEDTVAFWQEWSARRAGDGRWKDDVSASLVVLKALTYQPTGGLVAAVTTSLPEAVGGVRNWDYRYCWLRDATFTLQAMLRCGYTDEAAAWREWLLRAIAGDPRDLQIMYGIAGERRLPEYELPWLAGYEGSRPVRVGNGAANQLQLDVYGEVIDALALARENQLDSDNAAWALQRMLLDWLESGWDQPDEGIWEVRGPRRSFTHSKVMAWVAADRAVHAVERFGLSGPVGRWRALREEIKTDVLTHAYDAERNTFTQYYGSKALDAATLLIPQVGFLPPEDPRVQGTVEAVRRELSVDGFVRRYDTEPDGEHGGSAGAGGSAVDGLPGAEGTFLACSFWLADALHLVGRHDEALAQFERLLDVRNDVGLLAEEWDPVGRRQLGNVPQAFSHVALVNTAHNLGIAVPAGRCLS